MSAKKSFDVSPKRRAAPAAKKATPRKQAPARRKKTLRERREESRRTTSLLFFAGLLVVIGGVFYLLWMPEARIRNINASGVPESEAISTMVTEELSGTYYRVIPRDSFLFFPERTIRARILAAHPALSSLSIKRTGLDSIVLSATARQSAFLWCGTPEAVGSADSCFEADGKGLVFVASGSEASTTALHVFAELDSASSTAVYPLGAHVVGTDDIPAILRLTRAIQALGTSLRSVSIRGDEADLMTEGGTRITYVIGNESAASKDAAAAFPSLNLVDGSIEYIDLRFPGKVYLKRRE